MDSEKGGNRINNRSIVYHRIHTEREVESIHRKKNQFAVVRLLKSNTQRLRRSKVIWCAAHNLLGLRHRTRQRPTTHMPRQPFVMPLDGQTCETHSPRKLCLHSGALVISL